MSLVLLLSGPNLNLLGEREPAVYGTDTLATHVARAETAAAHHGLELEHLQTNHEGDLVEAVHAARGRADALVINAGALSHTSWSLHDARGRLRRTRRRAAHLQPRRQGTVPAHVGAGTRGVGRHRRLRRARLRARHRCRGRTPEGILIPMTTTTRANPYLPGTAPLPPIVVTGRLDRLRAAFDEHEVDALVVTTLPNVRYLTGFTGSAAVLVVTKDLALLTTDGRYRTQSAEQLERAGAPEVEISIGTGAEQREAACAALDGAEAARIGLEAGNITWSGQRAWAGCPERRQARPDRKRRRSAARAQRCCRARPHGTRRGHCGCRTLRGAAADEPRGHRGALRPGARHRHATRRCRGDGLRDHRGRRRELGQAPPPPRVPALSTGAIPSWSTSVPCSRATART